MNDHNRLVEQSGVYHVGSLAARLGYLFRQIKEHDKGVDAEIELTQSIGVESPIIGVQIKARSDFRKNVDNTVSITVSEQNLRYWKSFGRPVVLIMYSDKEADVYWTRVDNASSQTIKISLDQKLDESTVLKSNLPRKEFEGLVGIIDIGYEVAYFIEVGFIKHSTRVISVVSKPKLALFNAVPIMREWLKQAHSINKPLPPEDPRKAFAPNRFSDDERNSG